MKPHSFILSKSAKGNKYLYDRNINKTLFCHPILFFLLELKEKGIEPGDWFQQQGEEPIEIDGYGTVTKRDVYYYLQKYSILAQNGYFTTFDQQERFSLRLTPEMIKNTLANSRLLTFEITDNCNLDCEYCAYGKFYQDYDQRKNINIDSAAVKQLLTHLQKFWNSPLNVSHDQNIYLGFYGGEPLMNFSLIKEIVEYTQHLKLEHNRFSYSMTTNALLLENYMDFLATHQFNLLISLDGNKKSNAYRRLKNGQPAYPLILKNIQALAAKYPDYFNQYVNFNTVLHNKNSVAAIHSFFKKNFNKIPSISSLNTSGIREDQKKAFMQTYASVNESLYNSEDYSNIEKEMFIKLPDIQAISTYLHKTNDFSFNNYIELRYKTAKTSRFPTGTCMPFNKKIFVTVNGKILACERIGQNFVLGHTSAQEVIMDYEAIAANYNNWFDKFRKMCSACTKAELCTQCIFNLDLSVEQPVCNGFMSTKEYSQYIAAHIDFIEERPGIYTKIFKKIVFD